jgi:hypothetical protein
MRSPTSLQRRGPVPRSVSVSLRPLAALARSGTLALGLLVAGAARADGAPRQVVVVDVDAAASAIDAASLRAAIASDLNADAVALDDPRAAQARGTIRVALGGDHRALVVSYLARPEAICTVEVPADPRAIERAAVILAGNLARSEGSQLAADLRGQRAAAVPAGAQATPGANVALLGNDGDDPEHAAAQRIEADRLQRTLDYLAEREKSSRLAFAWTSLGLGAAEIGAGAYLSTQHPIDTWSWALLSTIGAGLVIGGGLTFLEDSPFERLAAYDRAGGGMQRTEETWARWARGQQTRRRVGGVLLLAVGALGLGFSVWEYATTQSDTSHLSTDYLAIISSIDFIAGGYVLATDSPFEAALHEYERTTGKVLFQDAGALGHLRLGLVPGGASAGFGGTF